MVISLVDIMQKLELNRIAQFYHIQLTRMEPPTEENVSQALGQRVQTLLEARYRQLGALTRERLTRLIPLARQLAEDPEQLTLLTLLLDGAYQQCLNPDAASLPPAKAPKTTPVGPSSERPAKGHAENGGRSRKSATSQRSGEPRMASEEADRPSTPKTVLRPDAPAAAPEGPKAPKAERTPKPARMRGERLERQPQPLEAARPSETPDTEPAPPRRRRPRRTAAAPGSDPADTSE